MKYGLCLHGKGSSRRCRKAATTRVLWTDRRGWRVGDDRCDTHATEFADLLSSRGMEPELKPLRKVIG